jgi:hypothetical protein
VRLTLTFSGVAMAVTLSKVVLRMTNSSAMQALTFSEVAMAVTP